jgi:Na+-transporting NADH:ubiquinone oxidoreductase subunit NqrB
MQTVSIPTGSSFVRFIKSFDRDARHYQLLFLGSFMTYGLFSLHWSLNPWVILTSVVTCQLVQWAFILTGRADRNSWKSAAITSLGLSLLLRVNAPWVMLLAAAVAISSKFFIRVNGKHVFNPANIGIVAAIMLTGQAWISPGQWGTAPMMVFFFLFAGFMVLRKVGRVETSILFLGTFFLLLSLRMVVYLGWDWDVVFHKMMNGSLLLFAFFMITDPRTIPDAAFGRGVWTVLVAVIVFWVASFGHLHTAPVWVLFFLSPLSILIDKIQKAPRFQWTSDRTLNSINQQSSISNHQSAISN